MHKEIYQIPNAKLKTGEIPVGILALNPKDGKGRILVGNKEDIQNNTATAKEFSLTTVQLSLIRILDTEEGIDIDAIADEYEQTPALNLAMTIASTEQARHTPASKRKTIAKIEKLFTGKRKPHIGIRTDTTHISTIRMQIWHLRQKLEKEVITIPEKNTYRLTKMSEIPKFPKPEMLIEPKISFFQKLAHNVQSFLHTTGHNNS